MAGGRSKGRPLATFASVRRTSARSGRDNDEELIDERLFGSAPVRSFAICLLVFWLVAPAQAADDPLAVLERRAGEAGDPLVRRRRPPTRQARSFVPPEDRIATFDQDGTLWVEHPLYTQAMFALDRVHELAPKHPDWKKKEPFKAVLAGDRAAMAKFSEGDWAQIIAATHAGMSTEDFLGDRQAVAGDGQGPALEAALHRARLPADAGGDGLPARQRLQDLHRHRRRPGVRARLQRAGLRRPAGAGGRIEHRHQVRRSRTASRC